jgi:hypothetical protein
MCGIWENCDNPPSSNRKGQIHGLALSESKTCGCAVGCSLRWECRLAMPKSQSAFVLSNEEFPMTMQVGMVGTDGVLIASDTQLINTPRISPREDSYLPRQPLNARKIMVSHAKGIAISCARVMDTARLIATKIISELGEENLDYPCDSIRAIAAAVLDGIHDSEQRDAHCLIAIALPSPKLYLLYFGDVNGRLGPICQKMESSIAAGDHVNSAIFWKERYYQRKPIKRLVPLAAHMIVSASKINRGSISGLEIVLCDTSGLHRIKEDLTRKLEAQANRWDKHIGSLFLKYKIRLRFDPNEAG